MVGDTPGMTRQQWLMVIGGIALAAIVVAVVFWYSSGAEGGGPAQPIVSPARVVDHTLVVGADAKAPIKVTVYEDFGSAPARAFDLASRDFLEADAKQGWITVTYKPFLQRSTAYGRNALSAYGAALARGPKAALTLHRELYDAQQTGRLPKHTGTDASFVAGSKKTVPGSVKRVPTVLLDGKPLPAAAPDTLANTLELRIAHQVDRGH